MPKNRAFTLLELLITTSITALLMLAISSLLITFLASAYKSRLSQSLREAGNQAMNQMLEMLRNANEISSPCQSQEYLSEISLINTDGLSTTFREENDRIASVSGQQTFYLTQSPVAQDVDYLRDLRFNCSLTPSGKKYLSVSFTLQRGQTNSPMNNPRSAFLDFHSGVVTRN